MRKIAMREGIGDVLAEGSRGAAARIGKGAERYAMHIKGLEPAGYEPRAMKGVALSFATANRGADHVGSLMSVLDFGMTFFLVPATVEPLDFGTEKVEILKEMEEWMQVMNSAVICEFYGVNITKEQLTQFVNLVTGWDISIDELRTIGERIWNLQRIYSIREGLRGREDDRWRDRLYEEPLLGGPAKGEVIQRDIFEQRLSEYYEMRGWDENGIPMKERLNQLGIEFEEEVEKVEEEKERIEEEE
jgi:aldehyde:ferredoxin oxidoreductase